MSDKSQIITSCFLHINRALPNPHHVLVRSEKICFFNIFNCIQHETKANFPERYGMNFNSVETVLTKINKPT